MSPIPALPHQASSHVFSVASSPSDSGSTVLMRIIGGARVWVALLCLCASLLAAQDNKPFQEIRSTCPMGREYYLYLPKEINQLRTYWLVVGVHGRQGDGKGASLASAMIANGRCIVVGPSFPEGHKVLANDSDTQRFCFRYPDLVIGCAPQSAGTWLTGDDGGGVAFDPELANRLVIGISCGMNDTGTAHRDEYTSAVLKPRIEWAREFSAKLAAHGFCYKASFIPGAGHDKGQNGGVPSECFDLSTIGLMPLERRALDRLLSPMIKAFAAGRLDEASKSWHALKPQVLELRRSWPENPVEGEGEDGWHSNPTMSRELRLRTDAYILELTDEWDRQFATDGK
jgi:hypothetical protein